MSSLLKKIQAVEESINFTPLTEKDLILLHRWLNTTNVKKWYGEDKEWSFEDIKNKYQTYISGYKIFASIKKAIYAFIINFNDIKIGYIQYYNFYDFLDDMNLRNICLPLNLAGLDIYIGNIEYCNKGLGAIIINQFLDRNVFDKFTACLVDPKRANLIAISSYKKAGFGNVQINFDDKVNYMIKKRY